MVGGHSVFVNVLVQPVRLSARPCPRTDKTVKFTLNRNNVGVFDNSGKFVVKSELSRPTSATARAHQGSFKMVGGQ